MGMNVIGIIGVPIAEFGDMDTLIAGKGWVNLAMARLATMDQEVVEVMVVVQVAAALITRISGIGMNDHRNCTVQLICLIVQIVCKLLLIYLSHFRR